MITKNQYKKFAILISTKNRKDELAITLSKSNNLLCRSDVICKIIDDGSNDGTYEYILDSYPMIEIERNNISKGYIYCRNKMLEETKVDYAISLDDDAHFLTENPLTLIEDFFSKNPNAGLLGFRVFWSKESPVNELTSDLPVRMKSFVGCGHVWRMSVWSNIPKYPEWFEFYGEEDFASYQLFKKGWEIHYLPQVLVHHRVDLKSRKTNSDYGIRLRRSLRSGWYLYFLFLPIHLIPRKMIYSVWIQLKLKVFKGDFQALKALAAALFDLVMASPKIIKSANRLSGTEFKEYQQLEEAKIYWKSE